MQDRIADLERENEGLKVKHSSSEDKWLRETDRLQHRLSSGSVSVHQSTRELHVRCDQLTADLQRVGEIAEEFKDKLHIAEGRVRLLETEGRRANEQASIEQENWSLQLTSARRKLEAAEEEAKELRSANQRLELDRRVRQEELSQTERLVETLKEELRYLRDHSDLQRVHLQGSLSSAEAQLGQEKAEHELQVRQLEVKNRALQELSENLRKQLEHLKKALDTQQTAETKARVDQVSLSHQAPSRVANDATRPQKSTTRTAKALHTCRTHRTSKPSKTDSVGTSRPQTSQEDAVRELRVSPLSPRTSELLRPESIASSQLPTSRLRENTEVDLEIRRVEETMARLNKQYRELLETSHGSSADLKSLRVELNAIGESLETKTNELYRLKRQQQSTLRERLTRELDDRTPHP
jgi:hypothetical protein